MTEIEMPTQSSVHIRKQPAASSVSRSPLEKAEEWLLNSGIYILDQGNPNYGAVYSQYDSKRTCHELVYAEATGYVLSFLKYLTTHGTHAVTDKAGASGNWLVKWAGQHHGIIAVGQKGDRILHKAYAFDNGVCCEGLLDLYELTGDEQYLACAEKIANWLVDEVVNPDGSVKPVFDFDSGRFIEIPAVWYGLSGSFHAKIAMALLHFDTISKKREARETALRIFDWTLRQQRSDGRFLANKHASFVFLHPHCYTVEALLFAYACERNSNFLSSAERAIDWMVSVQSPAGHFPRWYGRDWFRGKAADAQAQALRLLCLFHMLKPQTRIANASRKAVASLLSMQSARKDSREHGGFFEGDALRYRLFPRKSARMTSWATMFAIHALSLEGKAGDGDFFHEAKYLF